MKRSPIKPKRETPRRNDGRVQHQRIKPTAKAKPTEIERRHMDRVAAMGCLVCRCHAELHHVMKAPGKVRRRDHRFVVPLCPDHHRGNDGVHGMGSETAFFDLYLIDLAAVAMRLWEETARSMRPLNGDELPSAIVKKLT